MRLFMVVLAALPLSAAAIDPLPLEVSSASNQRLNTGDMLIFTVLEQSYEADALRFGLSPFPTRLSFQLVSEPGMQGDFSVQWQSGDGSVAVDYPGTLSWRAGVMQSSQYSGPIAVLYGSLDISLESADGLFSDDEVFLLLQAESGFENIGLPPKLLAQDLTATFAGGPLAVGGLVTDVRYIDPPTTVPEPNAHLVGGLGIIVFRILKDWKQISGCAVGRDDG